MVVVGKVIDFTLLLKYSIEPKMLKKAPLEFLFEERERIKEVIPKLPKKEARDMFVRAFEMVNTEIRNRAH